MGNDFGEKWKVERDDTESLITEHANAVIAEIFERKEKGLPALSPEALARLRFTEREREYKQTDSLVREIVIKGIHTAGQAPLEGIRFANPSRGKPRGIRPVLRLRSDEV